jgi:putative membrane protein
MALPKDLPEVNVMRRHIGLAMLMLAVVTSGAFGAESRSDDFIKKAIEGNLFEVQAGKMAQMKGASDGVRKFGTILAEDHAQARDKSMQVAKSIGVTPPTTPSKMQRDLLDSLTKLEGDLFDEHFISMMLDDHKRDVADYEKQSKGTDAVAKYAAETLPKLRDHLKTVQGLSNERATK